MSFAKALFKYSLSVGRVVFRFHGKVFLIQGSEALDGKVINKDSIQFHQIPDAR